MFDRNLGRACCYFLGTLSLIGCLTASCSQVSDYSKPVTVTPESLLHLGWTWPKEDTELPLWRTIAVGPDDLFHVTDSEGSLHCIAAAGEERWHYHGDYEFASPPVLGGDGTVLYFVTSNDELYAVGTDGQLKWVFEANQVVRSMPAVAPDGTVYLQTETGGYRIFPDGVAEPFPWPEWASPTDFAIGSQGYLYVSLIAADGVQILDPEGQLIEHCELRDFLYSGPVIGTDGTFFYTSYTPEDGIIIIAQDMECSVLWRYPTGEECGEMDCPLVASEDGAVYVGQQYGRILALDASTGHTIWQQDTDSAAGDILDLALGDDLVFAASSGAELLALDRETGEQVWSVLMYEANLPGSPQVTSKGELAIVHGDCLQVYTADETLVYQGPTPVPPPVDTAQAEKEITSFLLDFVIEYEIGGTIDYIQSSGQAWVDAPPDANIIVWAPVREGPEDEYFAPLDTDRPIQVWWYADGKLTETEDKLKSIEEYQQRYMNDPSSDIWAWGFYDLGILSITQSGQGAEVYVGASCGPLCGHGYRYTLRRSLGGDWWIIRSKYLWQS